MATIRFLIAVAVISFASVSGVCGGNLGMSRSILEQDVTGGQPWAQGGLEASFVTGPFFGPSFGIEGARERINYWGNSPRIAYNLTGIMGSSQAWYRGNLQVVGELFLAEIFDTVGGGSVVVGPNALVRYNFVQPGWKFVPYVQMGPGLVYTDTDNNAIGQHFCFQLNIGVGVRYMISDQWAATAEFDWHHMSNADMADHNLGSNEAGYQLGVSYFFQ